MLRHAPEALLSIASKILLNSETIIMEFELPFEAEIGRRLMLGTNKLYK